MAYYLNFALSQIKMPIFKTNALISIYAALGVIIRAL